MAKKPFYHSIKEYGLPFRNPIYVQRTLCQFEQSNRPCYPHDHNDASWVSRFNEFVDKG